MIAASNVDACQFTVNRPRPPLMMDTITIAGLAMIALWAVGTFALEAPGFIHGLLTLGVFFLVLGAIKRSERARKNKK